MIAAASHTLELGTMGLGLLAGLALFLFGIEQMTAALKVLAGERMKNVLARLTTNRFRAVFAGAFVTSIIQSSSVTTVLVVGFISAGLLKLTQAIGVIMGANIGTTITAQIIAFHVTQYAALLIGIGFGLLYFAKQERLRHYGNMVMGLGLIFFGMQMMSGATEPLRDYPPFVDFLTHLQSPVLAVLVSAMFTALIQSSSATTGIIIVLATQGWINLELGLALVLGANIGTCITALLAAIGKPREAIRAAVAHVLFNVIGVVVAYPLLTLLAEVVRHISPAHPELSGAARLALETPRQIANGHTVFNIANTLLLIGFVGPLARLVEWLVPTHKQQVDQGGKLQYLHQIAQHTPSLALDIVRLEVVRLGGLALAMLRSAFDPIVLGNVEAVEKLRQRDDDIDQLHGELVTAVGRLSRETLTGRDGQRLQNCMAAGNYFENIGDLIETTLYEVGMERSRHHVRISEQTLPRLRQLHERVTWSVEECLRAFANQDQGHARSVIEAKEEIARLAEQAETHLLHRLTADQPRRVETFRIETDLIEGYRRLYYFAKRIAKIVTDEMTPAVLTQTRPEHEPEVAATPVQVT